MRVGNAAAGQLQLDIYGQVIDAALRYVTRGGPVGHYTARMIAGFVGTVCKPRSEPDAGIWEPRSGPLQHTVSKAMCWVALDRALQLHALRPLPIDVAKITRERDAIRAAVERTATMPTCNYVAVFDSTSSTQHFCSS